MSKKLLFAMVITAVAGNTYAETTTQTVTTQNYVDTRVETKQDKIAGHPTTRFYPSSVITDTTTDGVIQKRVFLSTGANGMAGENRTWGLKLAIGKLTEEGGTLMTVLEPRGFTTDDVSKGVISAGIIDYAFGRIDEEIELRQKNKVCVRYIENAEETSENCLLWELPD